MRTNLLTFILFVLSTLLIACEPDSTRDSVRKSDLVGSRWELTELTFEDSRVELADFDPILLEFRQDLIGGETICNTYRVSWQLGRDGQVRTAGPLSQTRRGCLENAADVSEAYIAVLEQIHTIVLDGDTLIIDSRSGKLIFKDAK
ncbi:MAG: META domain-containing protein [Chloroflexota bacterium]